MNFAEFFSMGGYAAYVWPSFGLTLVLLVQNVRSARRLHASAREQAMRRLDASRKPA
ncbi:MAG: heme exporter protein CcmD [Steroidobacteraceae bacterium]